ncbi:MAG TPA: DUF6058 family natural product biosynthesis protein, partial [Gammaproteobacteria bacterium]
GKLRSNLGGADVPLPMAYFHPSALSHVSDILPMLDAGADAGELAAARRRSFIARYTEHVCDLHRLGLIEDDAWRARFADAGTLRGLAETEYGHWLAGTYGVCTRANTPEAVAVKECMVSNVDHVTQGGERETLDDASREKLVRYIRLFDRAAAPFAPFERATSSRHRLCVGVPRRYRLTITG